MKTKNNNPESSNWTDIYYLSAKFPNSPAFAKISNKKANQPIGSDTVQNYNYCRS